jgi:hypothetical protein
MLPDGRLAFRKAPRLKMNPYDVAVGEGVADVEAIRHLPVSGDPMRLLIDTKRRRAAAAVAPHGRDVGLPGPGSRPA